jgi:Protein tyrosine and serine/threonine kinase
MFAPPTCNACAACFLEACACSSAAPAARASTLAAAFPLRQSTISHLLLPLLACYLPPLQDVAEIDREMQQELRALSALRNKHIVRLHGAGWLDNRRFLVLEHLEGGTLASLLQRWRTAHSGGGAHSSSSGDSSSAAAASSSTAAAAAAEHSDAPFEHSSSSHSKGWQGRLQQLRRHSGSSSSHHQQQQQQQQHSGVVSLQQQHPVPLTEVLRIAGE